MAYKHTISSDRSFTGVAYNPRTVAEDYITDDSDVAVMKASIAKTCKLIPHTKPKIYQLPLKDITGAQSGFRKIEIGIKVTTSTKTILLVGETGAGKSTTINALVNYILNVNFEDDFRFRLVDELKEAKQAISQTAWVTIYTLYHQNNFRIPYNLTIVDTPGFGATEGLERDKEITKQLEALFKSKGPMGLDSLDAVGFVVMSSNYRLTPIQRYIYDSILALFGRDIEKNIYMLITFSDGQMPKVLDAIKEDNIPYKGYVKMNNSALYSDNQTGGDYMIFYQMFWTMGENSYQMFLVALQHMESISLTLSYEVLLERHRLEMYIEAFERNLYLATQTSKQLMVEKEALSEFGKQSHDNTNDGVKKMTAEQLVKKDVEELKAIEIQRVLLADNIKVSMDRLGEIALRPNPLSISNYIDLLVEKAEREGGPDNPEIEMLHAAKEKHIKMELLAQTKGNLTVAKVSEVFEQARIKSRSRTTATKWR